MTRDVFNTLKMLNRISASALDEFRRRLNLEWLIPFCNGNGYSDEGFDDSAVANLSSMDADDFMQAVDSGLVVHNNGYFSAPQSKSKEQIFWQGDRNSNPRKITLWLEPIITIGGLKRLQRDFKWAENLLGLQSKTWAFDLVAYEPEDMKVEHLVCEVKKTAREIDSLLVFMFRHLDSPAEMEHGLKGAERNAFKKVQALRVSKSKVFWALGPNRYEYIFNIVRDQSGAIQLSRSGESALRAPSNSLKSTGILGIA